MQCSICKKELVIGKEERYETLVDHCCSPNGQSPMRETYRCPDSKCDINTIHEGFWDDYGDFYCHNYVNSKSHIAYNSHRMQSDIEISKRDENFTFLRTYSWKFRIVFKYKANMKGEVLNKTPTMEISKRHWRSFKEYFTYYFQNKDERAWASWYKYTTNISMYKFLINRFLSSVAEFECSYANDGQKEIDRYKGLMDKEYLSNKASYEIRNKGKYKFLEHWDWYRDLSWFKIKRLYKSVCKDYSLEDDTL